MLKKAIIICAAAIFLLTGCNSKELNNTKAQLSEAQNKTSDLEKQLNDVKEKSKKLEEENETIKKEVTTLNEQLDLYRSKSTTKTVSAGISNPVEKEYAENFVDITNLNARWYEDSLYGNQVAGYTFGLKNKGNKDLEYVTVTIYFKGSDGSIVGEASLTPINPSSFTGDKILKANYSWKMDSGYYYQAKDITKDWAGEVEAKITELRFAGNEE